MEKRKIVSARTQKIVAYLKKTYPNPKSELRYETPVQFLIAVLMSAQCTDKAVNKCTDVIFKKYKTAADFAEAKPLELEKEISSITFYKNKARHIRETGKILVEQFGGVVPKTEQELVILRGVAYKTAHVVLGELYGINDGIPTDTHVKRFALRFGLTKNTDLKKVSKDLESLIPQEDWKYVNNGLVLYGRYICKARPHDCTEHPLTKLWPEAANRWF